MPEASATSKPRVLSGITATGKLTIGNYIGALSVWAEEQDNCENFLSSSPIYTR